MQTVHLSVPPFCVQVDGLSANAVPRTVAGLGVGMQVGLGEPSPGILLWALVHPSGLQGRCLGPSQPGAHRSLSPWTWPWAPGQLCG